MKKVSILAAAIAVALTGCGSDSSNSGVTTPPGPSTTTNKFIDAAVEGIYYSTSSGSKGITNSEGEFTAKSDDTVTFFIGGENGLKVGAASNRDVLTPFEAAGKYDRALNLAILLQSLDNQSGSASDEVLTIPDALREPDAATLAKMKSLSLDDRDSVTDFLTAMGVTSITSESEALAHMEKAFGEKSGTVRGSTDANPFVAKNGQFIRSIMVRQYDINDPNNRPNDKTMLVHADKMLPKAVFEHTRGTPYFTYQDSANGLIAVSDSDSLLSYADAEKYISCVLTGSSAGCNQTAHPDFTLNAPFSYLLLDKSKENTTPKPGRYDEVPFIEGNQQILNHYTPNKLEDDRDEGDADPSYQYETLSGSYDPITKIYTQIRSKTELNDPSNESSGKNRIEESLNFYYHVETPSDERYVDFTGSWDTTQICADGQNAVMRMVFDSEGATVSGKECNANSPADLEDSGKKYTYEELAAIDYWWFNISGRESKATLTDLNSVVRFCDDTDNGYIPGSGDKCPVDANGNNQEYIIKWEYQPAGTNWDEGLLTRRKMTPDGSTTGRVSIMQKIN
ncbi:MULTISPECIES: hypothetical protein [Vibrio]|uniref:Chromosome partitioning protein ParA n=1 Tax=Vibrio tasmaniensis TaxID=212663 RepID=A0A2N7NLV7_9VIBR|nr:hypothetical protein [Vibrio tasmaniensis]PMP16840.1 hypothetical protein BCS92_06795 [Vibrio tasmaniensis]TKG29608.1 hypothetical protein FC057_19395 [Vibrio tasmaniensis]TKG40875.1 hypothetical protein FC063_10075 [Vibrio tasmaniensis]TKG42139.1 hypothetical protein FC060_21380 [Vibrio tasmaniensis]TKG53363.1 hypothetical protein FC070_07620 [Vibrio tasmaniensis]